MLRICYRFALGVALLASPAISQQQLTSDYHDYSIRLTPWRPVSSESAGVLVSVRVNGTRTLRLVLDSGASGITLSRKTAKALGIVPEGEAQVAGLGEIRQVATAAMPPMTIGALSITGSPVHVTPESLTRGADGIIGLDVFEDFRIRLDAGAHELRLEAFPEKPSHPASHGGHLLFVRARINGAEGLFLVDTGAAVTSLASDFAWPAQPGTRTLTGASGMVEGKRLAPVSLEVAGVRVVERNPVTLDLAQISQRNGVKVAGILGYSLISRTPVTVDYREGLVAFK